ncbi:helix-turn-helix domain-containing protein [Mycobacterium manitobense]|uniref:Helix-turn-helix domain-containing protein n=1 Tax=[Mycobacterium] manitobense TaxID=190147 RepID=A0A9X2YKE1_9MYCO|nr:helix-turn-helix domain-containing protein [[Mycobacterium] manitobense]MCV7169075.1 helix-turn-helix domain-containing protein [[Mycobacterium] manitobense]
MNWYEKALEAANRIDPGHTSPWKLASTYALLAIAQSLESRPATPASSAGKQSGSDLLTVNEVAEMTRLTPATLRWWRSVGHSGPKSFKLGRRVLYRRADVEKWMQDASE